MKQINKRSAPQWFEQWKSDFVEVNNRQPHYKADFAGNDSDGIERRRMLREALIKEQGRICCYCMRRIYNNSAHIEHFFPCTPPPNGGGGNAIKLGVRGFVRMKK